MKFIVPDVTKFYEGANEVVSATKGTFGLNLLIVATGGLVTITGYGGNTYASYTQNAEIKKDGSCVVQSISTLGFLIGEAKFEIVGRKLKIYTDGYITLPILDDDVASWDFEMPIGKTSFSPGGISSLTYVQKDFMNTKPMWDNVFLWDSLALCVNSELFGFAICPTEHDGDITPIHIPFADKIKGDTKISASDDSVWATKNVGNGVLTMKYSMTEISGVKNILELVRSVYGRVMVIYEGKVISTYCKVQRSDLVNAITLAKAQWGQWSREVGLVWLESTEDGLLVELIGAPSEMKRTIPSIFGGKPFGASLRIDKIAQGVSELDGEEITIHAGWDNGGPLSLTDGVSVHAQTPSSNQERQMYPEHGVSNAGA